MKFYQHAYCCLLLSVLGSGFAVAGCNSEPTSDQVRSQQNEARAWEMIRNNNTQRQRQHYENLSRFSP